MRLVRALTNSLAVFRDQPVLTVVFFGASAISWVLSTVSPLANLFVWPFLIGGLYGLTHQALQGTVIDAEEFYWRGRNAYPTLLKAYIILAASVFLFALSIAGVGVSLLSVLGEDSLTSPAVIAVVATSLLAMFGVFLTVQFIDAAIVLDGATATEGFEASYRVFAENPLTVFVYSALRVALLIVGVSVLAAFGATLMEVGIHESLSLTMQVNAERALPLVLAGQAVVGTLAQVYHVALYETLR